MNDMPDESLPVDSVLRLVPQQKRTLECLYEEYCADSLAAQKRVAERYAELTEQLIREYDAKL